MYIIFIGDDMESIQREIDAIDEMENSIPKIFGLKSEKLQNALMNGRLILRDGEMNIIFLLFVISDTQSHYRRNRSCGIIGSYRVIEQSVFKKDTNSGMFYRKRM